LCAIWINVSLITPTNAPHQTYTRSQEITPTYFSKNIKNSGNRVCPS